MKEHEIIARIKAFQATPAGAHLVGATVTMKALEFEVELRAKVSINSATSKFQVSLFEDLAPGGQEAALDLCLATAARLLREALEAANQKLEAKEFSFYFSAHPPAVLYRGEHDGLDVRVTMQMPGGDWLNLPPRLDLANHSPSGFAWGYGGSGPAQLALALLADALRDDALALTHYQEFKAAVIEPIGMLDEWVLTAADVRGMLPPPRWPR